MVTLLAVAGLSLVFMPTLKAVHSEHTVHFAAFQSGPSPGSLLLRLRGGSVGKICSEDRVPECKVTTRAEAQALSKKAWKEIRRRKATSGTIREEEDKLLIADKMLADGNYSTAADMFKLIANVTLVAPPAALRGKKAFPGDCRSKTEINGSVQHLLLREPRLNAQAKPLREGLKESCNFARNSEEQLAAFLDKFGRGFRTRFPPEPNGHLHIGHAKAMAFNFGQAAAARAAGFEAETILRLDDTNPEAEDASYTRAILEAVEWLGFEPDRVTHTSDYFGELYRLALTLIDRGHAYVCHQTAEQVKHGRNLIREARVRRQPVPGEAFSPQRDLPPEVHRLKFEEMSSGTIAEGAAVLRMKGDFECDNPAMWDPVLYRIKTSPHPRTGKAWSVYPSYDMSHCIVDSLEGITHSCCTLEFASRQAADGPYYWLLDKLGLYKPATIEFSRCAIATGVLSKRALALLVDRRLVGGWDDPRLLTLAGLRRRGVSAAAIRKFIGQLGSSSTQASEIPLHRLEAAVREDLDTSAPRVFAVLRPLRISITNYLEVLASTTEGHARAGVAAGAAGRPSTAEDGVEMRFEIPFHAKNDGLGARWVTLGAELVIEHDDFRLEPADTFYGLTAGGTVGLLGVPFLLTCDALVPGSAGGAPRLQCRLVPRSTSPRPKCNVHWLSVSSGCPAVVRLWGPLLVEDGGSGAPPPRIGEPEGVQTDMAESGDVSTNSGADSWLKRVSPASLEEVPGALVEHAVLSLVWRPSSSASGDATEPQGSRGGGAAVPMQFVRLGYFILDSPVLAEDSASGKQVGGRGDAAGVVNLPRLEERCLQAEGLEGKLMIFNRIVALKSARDRP